MASFLSLGKPCWAQRLLLSSLFLILSPPTITPPHSGPLLLQVHDSQERGGCSIGYDRSRHMKHPGKSSDLRPTRAGVQTLSGSGSSLCPSYEEEVPTSATVCLSAVRPALIFPQLTLLLHWGPLMCESLAKLSSSKVRETLEARKSSRKPGIRACADVLPLNPVSRG